MFRTETVFILGAGASWHYGYPTGEALVTEVISVAKQLSEYCGRRAQSSDTAVSIPIFVKNRIRDGGSFTAIRQAWLSAQQEFGILSARLQSVHPLVIDYFLSWNESIREVGKLAIAAVLLKCEWEWLKVRANGNRRKLLTQAPTPVDPHTVNIRNYNDNWYRFIIHKLVYGLHNSKDLLLNNVSFITFNYDTSLERHIRESLNHIDLLQKADIDTFISNHRVTHVYGSLQHNASSNSLVEMQRELHSLSPDEVQQFLDACYEASLSINTIPEVDKDKSVDALRAARVAIETARVVYILGYGFDEQNNERIGLPQSLSSTNIRSGRYPKAIMATNYNDVGSVNKRMSRLLYGVIGGVGDGNLNTGYPTDNFYFEKSINNVYDALANDFDPLEEFASQER